MKSEASLGELLKTEPGVAQRSLGPAPSRPVIRGLDGDRVLILENGQRTDDLSSQSADHGVSVNPLAATRVEVVRGPATLLYGANAIGGLVNVVSEIIPTMPSTGRARRRPGGRWAPWPTRRLDSADYGDRQRPLGAARSAAPRAEPATCRRRSATSRTPSRAARCSTSGASWTREKAVRSALSYQFDDSNYGIPVVEDGGITITPRRHSFGARAQTRALNGFVTGVEDGSANVRHYRHQEREDGDVGTVFANDTARRRAAGDDAAARRPPRGHLRRQRIDAALRRASARRRSRRGSIRTRRLGVHLPGGGVAARHAAVRRARRAPELRARPAACARATSPTSADRLGVLVPPVRRDDGRGEPRPLPSATRRSRSSTSYGPHPGNFAFEVGNDDLDAERALGPRRGVPLAPAARHRRGHLVPQPHRRLRLPPADRETSRRTCRSIEFSADKALLQGVEAHGDIEIGTRVVLEVGADYVRGELRDTGEPLPRIPPLRATIGARYRVNALQIGAQVVVTADQTRVYGDETPTDGCRRAEAVRRLLDARPRPACTRSRCASTTRPTRPTGTTCPTSRTWWPEPGRAREADLRRPVLAGVCLRPRIRAAVQVERAVRS